VMICESTSSESTSTTTRQWWAEWLGSTKDYRLPVLTGFAWKTFNLCSERK